MDKQFTRDEPNIVGLQYSLISFASMMMALVKMGQINPIHIPQFLGYVKDAGDAGGFNPSLYADDIELLKKIAAANGVVI